MRGQTYARQERDKKKGLSKGPVGVDGLPIFKKNKVPNKLKSTSESPSKNQVGPAGRAGTAEKSSAQLKSAKKKSRAGRKD